MVIFNVLNETIYYDIVNIFLRSGMRSSVYNSRSRGIKDVRQSTVVAILRELMIYFVISVFIFFLNLVSTNPKHENKQKDTDRCVSPSRIKGVGQSVYVLTLHFNSHILYR